MSISIASNKLKLVESAIFNLEMLSLCSRLNIDYDGLPVIIDFEVLDKKSFDSLERPIAVKIDDGAVTFIHHLMEDATLVSTGLLSPAKIGVKDNNIPIFLSWQAKLSKTKSNAFVAVVHISFYEGIE